MKKNTFALCAAVALAAVSLQVHAADPIRFGLMAESSGPNAEAGVYQINGAKMALEEINAAGGVLGRPLELTTEDNQSTNPGSVLAVSKLTSGNNMTALLGSVRSTQIQAVAPTVLKVGLPMMIGGTDYSLTHSNNPWLFRARPNDGYSAKVIADYGVNTLGLKKWAIIHSTDAFGNGGKNMLIEALKTYGTYSIADFAEASSPETKAYADKYRAKYKIEPDLYSAWSYDGVKLLAMAIENAKSTKPEDIKKALHAIAGYKGVEGVYTFDKNGDGLHGYNIVKNEGGKIVFVKHIDFVPKD